MYRLKYLLLFICCWVTVAATAQQPPPTTVTMTTAQWNETQCQQLNDEEKRLKAAFEASMAEVQRKKEQLALDQLEIEVKTTNENLGQLDYELAKEKADLELRYAKRKAELQAKLQVLITRKRNSCAK